MNVFVGYFICFCIENGRLAARMKNHCLYTLLYFYFRLLVFSFYKKKLSRHWKTNIYIYLILPTDVDDGSSFLIVHYVEVIESNLLCISIRWTISAIGFIIFPPGSSPSFHRAFSTLLYSIHKVLGSSSSSSSGGH